MRVLVAPNVGKRRGILVGASGFEPEASCAQGRQKNAICLARLVLCCVTVHGFGPSLSVFGPKLDPTFGVSVIPLPMPKAWLLRRSAGTARESPQAAISHAIRTLNLQHSPCPGCTHAQSASVHAGALLPHVPVHCRVANELVRNELDLARFTVKEHLVAFSYFFTGLVFHRWLPPPAGPMGFEEGRKIIRSRRA